LAAAEHALLPRRMRRALGEMAAVLDAWIRTASHRRDRRRLDAYRRIRRLLEQPADAQAPDWEELASRWLEIVRPVWYEQLQTAKRRRPLLLRDIRNEVISREDRLGETVIERLGESALPTQASPSERVIACIIGQRATE